MEVKEGSRLVLLTEHNLESAVLVFYITAPSEGFHQFGFREASSFSCHIVHETVIHLHDRWLLLTLD